MGLKQHLLTLIWALIILVLTLMPGKAIPDVKIIGADKLVHFFIFGTLMILMLRGYYKLNQASPLSFNYIALSFLLCILYGVLIEFIQNYIPGRSFSIYDMIANSIGVVIGFYIYKVFKTKLTA